MKERRNEIMKPPRKENSKKEKEKKTQRECKNKKNKRSNWYQGLRNSRPGSAAILCFRCHRIIRPFFSLSLDWISEFYLNSGVNLNPNRRSKCHRKYDSLWMEKKWNAGRLFRHRSAKNYYILFFFHLCAVFSSGGGDHGPPKFFVLCRS